MPVCLVTSADVTAIDNVASTSPRITSSQGAVLSKRAVLSALCSLFCICPLLAMQGEAAQQRVEQPLPEVVSNAEAVQRVSRLVRIRLRAHRPAGLAFGDMPHSAEVVLDDPELLEAFQKHLGAAQETPVEGTFHSTRTVVGIFETDDGRAYQGLFMTETDETLARGVFLMCGGPTAEGPRAAKGRPSRQLLWLKQASVDAWHERAARTWARTKGEGRPVVVISPEQLADAPESMKALRCDGLAAGDVIAALPRLLRVQDLELICPVAESSPAGELFQQVATLPRLQRLWVRGPWCGDAEVAALCIGKLRTIALDYTAVTAVGLAQLASLPSLRRLELWGRIDVSLLSQLHQVKQLRELYICGATGKQPGDLAAELARLRQALPGCRVEYRPDARRPPKRIHWKK